MVKTEKIPEGHRATEAGILPVDWQVKRLSEVATELTERAGQDKYETVSISAGIGFVNQAEKFGKELSGKQYEKYIVLHQGDFSYNKGNSKTSPQGCIYRLNDRESAAVPNVFESFRIKEQNADYYEQLFLSGFLNRQLYSRINRGVRDDGLLNLTGKDFYSCTVPVPPVDEQKKIAEVLLCCDRVIDLKQQLIIELQQLKKGFLQAVFPTKGCNKPDIRFPGFSEVWEQRKYAEVIELLSGQDFNPEEYNEDGIGIPYLTGASCIENGCTTAVRWTEKPRCIVKKGDTVLVCKGSGYGTIATVNQEKAHIARQFMALKVKKHELDHRFNYFLLNSIMGNIKTDARGLIAGIARDAVLKQEIVIPCLNEQTKIGEYFDNLDKMITLHQRELEETKKKKRGLAKLLLTGGVRVPT